MKCKYHGCVNEVVKQKSTQIFCNRKCGMKFYVDLKRKRLKVKAVLYKGGKCIACSYDKCIWALEFHHRDRAEKSFSIAAPETRAWEKLRVELDKCDLLCANCHREKEYEEILKTKKDLYDEVYAVDLHAPINELPSLQIETVCDTISVSDE